jgi:hexosaminidase
MSSRQSQVRVCWKTQSTPRSLHTALRTIAEEYPVSEGSGSGVLVTFEPQKDPRSYGVSLKGKTAVVRYHTTAQAMRCVGSIMSGMVADGRKLTEVSRFDTFGIMLDCSRNAVMTVDHFKKWLRRLSLLGYNTAMLYTEETYRLQGEPYFGYMRGAYSARELKEVDAYARRLGIEMIPCIQTLGHLAHVLKWGAYSDVKDTQNVLLVGEEKTYALIEKMISHWASVYRTRRIHIGMDEAWDLGRGQYLTKNGFTDEFEIFNRHLSRVTSICAKYGFKPMIWSDMYFSLGSPSRGYYDKNCHIPDSVRKRIPKKVQLVYWDYYHEQSAFYADYVRKHRALGFDPLMASGVWTWSKFWHDRRKTEAAAGACIDGCVREKVKEILFTMWGDSGAYCDFDSALAGLTFVAEKSFSKSGIDDESLKKRFAGICKSDYAAHMRASDISHAPISADRIAWDDPLVQQTLTDTIAEKRANPEAAVRHFAGIAKDLARHTDDREAGDLNHAMLIAKMLSTKIDLDVRLRTAHARHDLRALKRVRDDIPAIRKLIAELSESLRAMWLRHNKPFGLDVIQSRFATLSSRYQEAGVRIGEVLNGKTDRIEELEETRIRPRAKRK